MQSINLCGFFVSFIYIYLYIVGLVVKEFFVIAQHLVKQFLWWGNLMLSNMVFFWDTWEFPSMNVPWDFTSQFVFLNWLCNSCVCLLSLWILWGIIVLNFLFHIDFRIVQNSSVEIGVVNKEILIPTTLNFLWSTAVVVVKVDYFDFPCEIFEKFVCIKC